MTKPSRPTAAALKKKKKKRAPVTGDLVGVRIQPDLAKQIDLWRRTQDDLPNRPEAIRRLIELGLRGFSLRRLVELGQ
jgi:hypothetical protein